ncbi:precorrin-3B C(17)-methyltransferase [Alkaliphilus peptidifermentans]|uniref:Cobalt-precorrin 3 C17-methyltransferase n=1 Tax=Alkaliphilus peptidifermentans DSM 18978 TaxID=1120976 RepID=A0A1G5AQB7_9FIRM|nr:precorrin-3B C(17)-methyltransferase [Alkaliphilus peptidifermentans]SCX80061.1 cobalt-precorrin 3 C17-methyltransferase [Alkaliphilus peptidifermentans DSM 18978]
MTKVKGRVAVVGLGPGDLDYMIPAVYKAIQGAEVVIGYKTYIDLIKPLLEGKQVINNGMRKEIERCQLAVEMAEEGKNVVLVSSGDPGIYGMAGALLEVKEEKNSEIDVEILPGITAVSGAAASLGAPLMHDFVVISLSDLLTEWEVIKKRLYHAAAGDFVVALYNPKSMGRTTQIQEAVEILLRHRNEETPVGIVKNAKRHGEKVVVTTLGKMLKEEIDMTTVVIIGNSNTYIKNGKIITPRGYSL